MGLVPLGSQLVVLRLVEGRSPSTSVCPSNSLTSGTISTSNGSTSSNFTSNRPLFASKLCFITSKQLDRI